MDGRAPCPTEDPWGDGASEARSLLLDSPRSQVRAPIVFRLATGGERLKVALRAHHTHTATSAVARARTQQTTAPITAHGTTAASDPAITTVMSACDSYGLLPRTATLVAHPSSSRTGPWNQKSRSSVEEIHGV